MTTQSNTYRLNQKEPHILTLIIMSSFASMGAVIFTPALPQIAKFFQITEGRSQLAVTLFLLGYAMGQLIYGPLSNRFGRKAAFYIGIGVATIGSILSIVAEPLNSFEFLIIGRLLEALGSSAGLVITFTIINDHYYPQQARRIISYVMLAFAVIPGIAIFIGGILVTHFGWISCFYFLLIYGLFLLIPASRLAETATVLNEHALHVRQIVHNYAVAFKNRLLRNTSLFFAFSTMCIYIYSALAPFIAIHYLSVSPQKFGILGLIPYMGTAVGAIVSSRLTAVFSAESLIKLGYIAEIVASILLGVLFYLGLINLVVLICCGFIFMFGGCLMVGNGSSLATATVEDKANGSAVMQFINVGMPVCGTFALSVIPGSPLIKLPVSFLVAMLIMLGMKIIFKNKETTR